MHIESLYHLYQSQIICTTLGWSDGLDSLGSSFHSGFSQMNPFSSSSMCGTPSTKRSESDLRQAGSSGLRLGHQALETVDDCSFCARTCGVQSSQKKQVADPSHDGT